MVLSDLFLKYSKNSSHNIYITSIETHLGTIAAGADDEYVYMVMFENSKNTEKHVQALSKQIKCTFVEGKNKVLDMLELELHDYLTGKLKKFTVPIKMFGSDFHKEVWNEILNTPYASTRSYGHLAKEIGRTASHSRAVGAACGANPHVIVIPCHRLVLARSIGGFSCGLYRKEWLIEHEIKNNKT